MGICWIWALQSASASFSSKLADHSIVTTRLNLSIPRSASHKRNVWSYTKADWDGLREELQETDWTFEACSDASRAAALMTRTILEIASKHIPQRVVAARKVHTHGSPTKSCTSLQPSGQQLEHLRMTMPLKHAALGSWLSTAHTLGMHGKGYSMLEKV